MATAPVPQAGASSLEKRLYVALVRPQRWREFDGAHTPPVEVPRVGAPPQGVPYLQLVELHLEEAVGYAVQPPAQTLLRLTVPTYKVRCSLVVGHLSSHRVLHNQYCNSSERS